MVPGSIGNSGRGVRMSSRVEMTFGVVAMGTVLLGAGGISWIVDGGRGRAIVVPGGSGGGGGGGAGGSP